MIRIRTLELPPGPWKNKIKEQRHVHEQSGWFDGLERLGAPENNS